MDNSSILKLVLMMAPTRAASIWLVVTQSVTTNIRRSRVDAALVGAIMSTNFKIEELSMSVRRASCIPNHYICRGPLH